MMTKFTKLICFASVMALTGCATTSNLNPEKIGADDGALMGRVTVLVDGQDKTGNCYANFTDKDESRKVYINLDESGWVFSSVKVGDTYLSTVICTVGGIMKHNVQWSSRELKFNVLPQNKLAYFGHVTVSIQDKGPNPAWYLFGAVGAAIAASQGTGQVSFVVDNELEDALKELHRRYSAGADRLTVFTDIPANHLRVPASK